jgi:hypothetical protein
MEDRPRLFYCGLWKTVASSLFFWLLSIHPVFQQQTRNSLEFAQVIADQDQALAARMRGDMQIIEANRLPRFFENGPDVSIVPGGLIVVAS